MTPTVTECRLCGAKIKTFEIVGDFVYGGSADQKFYRCASCDVAFLYPALTAKEEERFYAKEFEQFMEKRAGQDYDWSGPEGHFLSSRKQYERRLPFFQDLLKPRKRVLEIGCSSGFMLAPLKEQGLDVVGVEPSGGFGGFLKKSGVKVYESLEEVGAKEKDKFDIVMHFFVLEHVAAPLAFLKQGLALLNDKGVLVFEIPSRDDPLLTIYNIPAFQRFYWSVAHNYYFNRQSLEYLLTKLDKQFEIVGEQRYDISNHMTWALEGKPGGQKRFSNSFTRDLERAYLESMIKTGHCDTLIARVYE
jgi:2-polyprenyl-3-methyl-5-hydroxy-6-metoxy-1,4-benzoquinol methylase